jgi:Uncharacterized Fe-S protein PflX, homolog of pyruvate formate lyase activating proteins
MSQYTPYAKAAEHPPLDRRISKYEYEIALDAMIDLGFDNGYVQSRRSAQKDFIPDFQSPLEHKLHILFPHHVGSKSKASFINPVFLVNPLQSPFVQPEKRVFNNLVLQ